MNKLVAEIVEMFSSEGTGEEAETNKLVEDTVDQVEKCDDVVLGIVDRVNDWLD